LSLLALLLAASECAGLFRAAAATPPVTLPGNCLMPVVDATGSVAEACAGSQSYRSVDGATLGSSDFAATFLAARARGFWALGNAPDRSLLSIDRDGKLLGSLPAPLPGGDVLQTPLLLPDPNGGAIIVDVVAQPGASATSTPSWQWPWQVVLRRVSEAMTVVDGPRIIDRGPSQAPTFQGQVSTDGTFVLTERGWHFPPLRNNQIAARWFDARGAPLGGWFLALDQAPFGGPALLLGDGSVLIEGRYRRTRLAKDPLPAPVWLPRELVTSAGPSVFVLPDRIAVMRPSSTSCAIDLEIRAPSGDLCGSQTLQLSTVGGGVCLQGFAVVGQDGTLLVRDYSQKALQVWPRLFAPH